MPELKNSTGHHRDIYAGWRVQRALTHVCGAGSGHFNQVFQVKEMIRQVWEIQAWEIDPLDNLSFLSFLTQSLERSEVGGVLRRP